MRTDEESNSVTSEVDEDADSLACESRGFSLSSSGPSLLMSNVTCQDCTVVVRCETYSRTPMICVLGVLLTVYASCLRSLLLLVTSSICVHQNNVGWYKLVSIHHFTLFAYSCDGGWVQLRWPWLRLQTM